MNNMTTNQPKLNKLIAEMCPTGERNQKRESVLSKLPKFFERFFDISSSNV
jgi:hypothetical protein